MHKFKKVLIFLVIIIILFSSYYFLKPKEQIINSLATFESKQMISYVKDNKLYFINSKGKNILLYDKAFENNNASEFVLSTGTYSNNQPYSVFIEKDTNIYFLGDISVATNSGTLFRYDKETGTKKIDEQVRLPIYVSPDCKKVAYTKLNGKIDNKDNLSDLYIYEKGQPIIKILENCSEQDIYDFSWKTNAVAFTEINSESNINKIYIKKQSKEKELVDEGLGLFPLFYSDDGNTIAYQKSNSKEQTGGASEQINDYYIKKVGQKPEYIVKSEYFKLMPLSFSAYYIGNYDKAKRSGDLFYKELNKKPVKIAGQVKNIFLEGNHYDYKEYIDSLKQNRIFFQNKDGEIFMVKPRQAPQKICDLKTENNAILQGINKDFTIIPHGTGKITEAIYDKSKKKYTTKEISSDATILFQNNIVDYNTLFYMERISNYGNQFCSLDLTKHLKTVIQDGSKDMNTSEFASSGSASSSSVRTPQIIGSTLYYTLVSGDKTELYIKRTGYPILKIAVSNGMFFPYDENTVYYWDPVGDLDNLKYNLYVYKYGKGSELVQQGVSKVSLSY